MCDSILKIILKFNSPRSLIKVAYLSFVLHTRYKETHKLREVQNTLRSRINENRYITDLLSTNAFVSGSGGHIVTATLWFLGSLMGFDFKLCF